MNDLFLPSKRSIKLPNISSILIGILGILLTVIAGCGGSSSELDIARRSIRPGTPLRVAARSVPIYTYSEDLTEPWLAPTGETLDVDYRLTAEGEMLQLPVGPNGDVMEVVPIEQGDSPRYLALQDIEFTRID